MQSANLTNDGSTLLPQSIMRVLSATFAGLTYELYAYLDYISKMAIPATSEGEYLESWANLKGVYRLTASFAGGTCAFSGTIATVVPAGTLIVTSTHVRYATTAAYTIGTSSPVGFTATVAGVAGNAAIGVALNLVSPLAGVNSATTAATAIIGGADAETDASLRARMLLTYANPPNGGSQNDFIEWALQVPGVTRAWVSAVGAGTVLLYVMFDQVNTGTNGFPVGSNGGATLETRTTAATGNQLAVANWIYPLRPVTALVTVSAPTPSPINFTIQSLNPSSVAIKAAIQVALADLFVREGSPLGTSIYPSDVNQAIESAVSGGVYTLVTPVAPITVAVGALPTLGTITWL